MKRIYYHHIPYFLPDNPSIVHLLFICISSPWSQNMNFKMKYHQETDILCSLERKRNNLIYQYLKKIQTCNMCYNLKVFHCGSTERDNTKHRVLVLHVASWPGFNSWYHGWSPEHKTGVNLEHSGVWPELQFLVPNPHKRFHSWN